MARLVPLIDQNSQISTEVRDGPDENEKSPSWQAEC